MGSKKTSDLDLAPNRLQVIDEATEKTSFHHRDTEGTEKTSKCSARLFNDDGQNTDLLTGQVKKLRVLCVSVVISMVISVESSI